MTDKRKEYVKKKENVNPKTGLGDTAIDVRRADDPKGASDSGIPGIGEYDPDSPGGNAATGAGMGGNKAKGTTESDHNIKK